MLSYLTLQPSRYLFNCFPAKSKQNIALARGELIDLPNESIATAESSLSRTEVLSRSKHPSVVCANETHHAVWQQPHLQPYACSLFLTSCRPWPPLDSSLNIPRPVHRYPCRCSYSGSSFLNSMATLCLPPSDFP